MVVPIIPILIGAGMMAGMAGNMYAGHYNRKSMYNQKEMYDMQIDAYKKAKAQYDRDVGRPYKNPFNHDYYIKQLEYQKANVDNSIKANWGGQLSSVGYGMAGMAGLYGRTQNPYQGGGGNYENWGGMYGHTPGPYLYNSRKGKRWL